VTANFTWNTGEFLIILFIDFNLLLLRDLFWPLKVKTETEPPSKKVKTKTPWFGRFLTYLPLSIQSHFNYMNIRNPTFLAPFKTGFKFHGETLRFDRQKQVSTSGYHKGIPKVILWLLFSVGHMNPVGGKSLNIIIYFLFRTFSQVLNLYHLQLCVQVVSSIKEKMSPIYPW